MCVSLCRVSALFTMDSRSSSCEPTERYKTSKEANSTTTIISIKKTSVKRVRDPQLISFSWPKFIFFSNKQFFQIPFKPILSPLLRFLMPLHLIDGSFLRTSELAFHKIGEEGRTYQFRNFQSAKKMSRGKGIPSEANF